jgi:hypothetical protein
MKDQKHLGCLGLALGVLITAAPAWAALGGDTASIQADRSELACPLYRERPAGPFTVHEMASAATTVREYSAGGRVFAVAWAGRAAPDLRPLLGPYFDDFQAMLRAAQTTARRRRVPYRLLKGKEVSIEFYGRFRAIGGRAYVEGLLPNGVSLDAVR